MKATLPIASPPPLQPSVARMPAEAQIGLGFALLFVLATACWALLPYTGHMFPALVFLLAVVLAGTRWHRGPVLVMAVSAALVWNYFFIPPRFTFHIAGPEDVVMFGLFFVVALSMGHLITRLREREEALESQHRASQELMAEKHRAELAAEAERLHRTLLDSVSHELKTPLTIIRTGLDALGTDNPYAAEIDTAARRLQRIVEDLLEITRVESDAVKPAPEWSELDDVLDAAIEPLRHELAGHPLHITDTTDLPLLWLDGRLLSLSLINLLRNATLHTPADSGIDIAIQVTPERLELRVRDHGPGLPPEAEERVFGKFYRGPGAPAGGTGLGLAISRGLTRAMKGDLTARNHPEGGAEFTLTLPVRTRQP